ncbi:MAG: hypothetical protein ACREXW_00825 [Gammaproteobacteria bacterium]
MKPSSAYLVLAEARGAGITIAVHGDMLMAGPKAALTDEVRSLIREHKPAILALLAVAPSLGRAGTP